MRFRFVAILLMTAVIAGTASGSDLEYGHDALPVLSSDATLIVVVAEAAEVPVHNRLAQLFRFRLSERIRGSFGADQLLALHPRSSGAMTLTATQNSFAFLAGPLSAAELEEWEVQSSEPVFILVGGPGGVVRITSPARRKGILDYLALGSTKATAASLQWSLAYLKTSDQFLQYSAIHQLNRFRDDSGVLIALSNAITAKDLNDANYETAFRVIASSGTGESTALLKNIAENQSLDVTVRRTSVFKVNTLPGGLIQLEEWAKGSDQILKAAANEALIRQQSMPQ